MADKPIPTNEGEFELFIENLAAKIGPFVTDLGLSVGDTTRLGDSATTFDYLRNMANQVNDSKDEFFSFKDQMFNGPTEGLIKVPVFPVLDLPEGATPGIITWTRQLVKRIKAAPGYTQQIGETLGLVTSGGEPISPDTIIPEMSVKAMNDGAVEIKFKKQGMTAIRIDYRKKGDSGWKLAGVYSSSPAVHFEQSTPPDTPEAREYRGILLKKNDPVTQYSPTYNVVTTP